MKLTESSLGLLETRGFIGAVTAADAMLKAANVTVFQQHQPGGGRVTLLCMGELSACAAAVDAGACAAARVGELLASSVIARPEEGAIGVCRALRGEESADKRDKAAQPVKAGKRVKSRA